MPLRRSVSDHVSGDALHRNTLSEQLPLHPGLRAGATGLAAVPTTAVPLDTTPPSTPPPAQQLRQSPRSQFHATQPLQHSAIGVRPLQVVSVPPSAQPLGFSRRRSVSDSVVPVAATARESLTPRHVTSAAPQPLSVSAAAAGTAGAQGGAFFSPPKRTAAPPSGQTGGGSTSLRSSPSGGSHLYVSPTTAPFVTAVKQGAPPPNSPSGAHALTPSSSHGGAYQQPQPHKGQTPPAVVAGVPLARHPGAPSPPARANPFADDAGAAKTQPLQHGATVPTSAADSAAAAAAGANRSIRSQSSGALPRSVFSPDGAAPAPAGGLVRTPSAGKNVFLVASASGTQVYGEQCWGPVPPAPIGVGGGVLLRATHSDVPSSGLGSYRSGKSADGSLPASSVGLYASPRVSASRVYSGRSLSEGGEDDDEEDDDAYFSADVMRTHSGDERHMGGAVSGLAFLAAIPGLSGGGQQGRGGVDSPSSPGSDTQQGRQGGRASSPPLLAAGLA